MLDYLTPFGPLHILLLHLPIGGFAALWFAWIASSNRKQYVYSKSFLVLNLFLLLSTGLSVVTGWLYMQQGAYGTALDLHELSGYMFAALVALQYVFLLVVRKRPVAFFSLGYYLLVLAASAAMVFTSHFGGELVHGKGFVEKAFRQKTHLFQEADVLGTEARQKANVVNEVFESTEHDSSLMLPTYLQAAESKPIISQEEATLSQDFNPFAPIEESVTKKPDSAGYPFAPLPNDVSDAPMTPPVSDPENSLTLGQQTVVPAAQSAQLGVSIKWDQASAELAHKRFNRAARAMKNHCYSCHGATKVKGAYVWIAKSLR